MANLKIESPIQGKSVDLKAYRPFDLTAPGDEPPTIGSWPLGSTHNGKRIDQMTLDDYRRGVRKVLEESQLTSRA